ncbi:MAG TPA: hypothetical protein VHZ99_00970 [Steroidobacteraceae bacterium]|jgi:hypothetical protein|nr:hypothetical protein [Steroidobacteraceae bacterium]
MGVLTPDLAGAAGLDPQVLAQVQAATYEVVIAKPATDPLTYARPLPMDLLPFQERNDKYFSIGTAFGIGIVQREHPWDGGVHADNDVTEVCTIVGTPGVGAPFVLYSALRWKRRSYSGRYDEDETFLGAEKSAG